MATKTKEPPVDEKETPEEAATETPTSELIEDTSTSAKVPEDFQKKCDDLLSSCTLPQLRYLSSEVDAKTKEMSKTETAANLDTESFSADAMPEV